VGQTLFVGLIRGACRPHDRVVVFRCDKDIDQVIGLKGRAMKSSAKQQSGEEAADYGMGLNHQISLT
jgi:hypothetical protein